jgi:hypothetical protein
MSEIHNYEEWEQATVEVPLPVTDSQPLPQLEHRPEVKSAVVTASPTRFLFIVPLAIVLLALLLGPVEWSVRGLPPAWDQWWRVFDLGLPVGLLLSGMIWFAFYIDGRTN